MLDYRFNMAVMVTEDRIRDLRREAALRRQLEGARQQPNPSPSGRRRWSVAHIVGRLVPKRDGTPATTSAKPL